MNKQTIRDWGANGGKIRLGAIQRKKTYAAIGAEPPSDVSAIRILRMMFPSI